MLTTLKPVASLSIGLCLWMHTLSPTSAGDTSLSLELNGLSSSEKGCLFTFVVSNTHTVDFNKVGYEVAIFNKKGLVDRLTVFDFRSLPAGKTKVRQFDLPRLACTDVGRMLINGASTCTIGGTASDLCEASFTATSRVDVAFE